MTKLKIGTMVKLTSKPCSWHPQKSNDLAKEHGLTLGVEYPILQISECKSPCKRFRCPGRIRIGNMKEGCCWGYSWNKGEMWFGLDTDSLNINSLLLTLDQILGL